MKATEWAFDRTKEAFEQVAQDEAGKLSIVEEIMIRSTDYPRRIIAPVGGQGGVTMSYLCPQCNSFTIGRLHLVVTAGKTTKWWCAICGEKYDWKRPNRLLVVQTGDSVEQANSGPSCKFRQCVKVIGESARRWRRLLVEHCEGPG